MPAAKLPETKLFASRTQTGEDGTAKNMVHLRMGSAELTKIAMDLLTAVTTSLEMTENS
jgi:hypothetical protein